jgi:hypothetical protein
MALLAESAPVLGRKQALEAGHSNSSKGHKSMSPKRMAWMQTAALGSIGMANWNPSVRKTLLNKDRKSHRAWLVLGIWLLASPASRVEADYLVTMGPTSLRWVTVPPANPEARRMLPPLSKGDDLKSSEAIAADKKTSSPQGAESVAGNATPPEPAVQEPSPNAPITSGFPPQTLTNLFYLPGNFLGAGTNLPPVEFEPPIINLPPRSSTATYSTDNP